MAAKKKNKEQTDGFISKATLRRIHLSPRKARLVVDLVRGRRVGVALNLLRGSDKKTAPLLTKLILSAAQSAKIQSGIDVDELFVKSAFVNESAMLKRFMPRAHGRATPIRKRHSSITVVLDEVRSKAA